MAQAPIILVFDSGLGGLTVFREIRAARPDARFIYIADDAGFPYGDLGEALLISRVVEVLGNAITEYKPDLVVVACNTASTLALKELRGRFAVPFVGTVPAIKPACARSTSKLVSVLGTQATVDREYTRSLIREFGEGCTIHLVGSSRLATFAEAELAGDPPSDAAVRKEIAGCFVESGGNRTDTVVLACTHYPLLLHRFRVNASWPVTWLDPAPAIARRVADLVGDRAPSNPPPPPRILFTSGREPASPLGTALVGYGF